MIQLDAANFTVECEFNISFSDPRFVPHRSVSQEPHSDPILQLQLLPCLRWPVAVSLLTALFLHQLSDHH